MKKVRFGRVHADEVRVAEAVDEVTRLVRAGAGGFVVTPNVDHVVLAERNAELVDAYAHASLSLVDGMPLVWLSRLLGHPLPQKISGSDFVWPLLRRAARDRWRLYALGGMPGVGERALERAQQEVGDLHVAGIDAPPLGFELDPEQEEAAVCKLVAARPHLVLVALGCPKQELLMHRWRSRIAPAVSVGIGATLDFLSGTVRRAPPWMSERGLEWLFRMSQDPKRLARRYLVRDLRLAPIIWRMLRMPRRKRVFFA